MIGAVPLGQTIYIDFVTHNPSTGAVSDASSTPTVEVFENDNDTAILTPTAVKRTGKTGNYRVEVVCTSGNGLEEGKSYNVVVSATVNSIAAKAVVARFLVLTLATGADLATVDGNVDGLVTTAAGLATQTSVDTIDSNVDGLVTTAAGLATSASISALDTLIDGVAADVSGLDGATPPTAAQIVDALLDAALGFSGSRDVTVLDALQAIWSMGGGTVKVEEGYLNCYRPDGTALAFRFQLDSPTAPTSRTRAWE